MITEQAYKDSAAIIGCEVAAIKSVAEVESSGNGMLSDSQAKILFEPHIFWKQLRRLNIDPQSIPDASDILYPVWGTKPYGKVSAQPQRLERAIAINREAALMSASYGRFQIMGFNFSTAGYNDIEEFYAAMNSGEDEQLKAFTTYIKNTHLDDELRNLDWKGFARGYNGAAYAKNNYDKKLAAAYAKFKGSL